jgi:hypothetical protein
MSADEPPRDFEMITTAPAGSLSATAEDMANFMIAQLQGGRFKDEQILKPETAAFMHSPSLDEPSGFATLAHGFFRATENGRLVLGHGGDTIVFHTDLNLLPDEGVGIFVSFNSRGARDAVYGIRQRLFADFIDRYFPEPDDGTAPPVIATAAADAKELAGSYESSRRIETSFLGLFYILQQATVQANDDGTISIDSEGDSKYREIEKDLWREENGDHMLKVSRVDGYITIADSQNPTSVLQAVPAIRNASVNIAILSGSLIALVIALLTWPISWWYRRKFRQPPPLSGTPLVAYRLTRLAALADFAYLFGWYSVLAPILQNRLDTYNTSLDGTLRMLQFGALIPILGAAVGIWNTWLTMRSERHWIAKIASAILAAALIGIVWIGWAGSLLNFNLEY